MSAIRRFLALPARSRAVVARSLLLLPVVAALLRTAGFARTRSWMRKLRPRAPAIGAVEPREIARLVHAAAARLGIGCLPRSVVLLRFLESYGRRARIRIGVHKTSRENLAAHAWVELDGRALGERADLLERHVALPELPAADRACPGERS
jgi:hypothetical protein